MEITHCISKSTVQYFLLAMISCLTSGCFLGDVKEVKYFARLHSENVYSFDAREEFSFRINEKDIENRKTYYEVHYESDKVKSARRYRDNQLVEEYGFDDEARVVLFKRGDMQCQSLYEPEKKEVVCYSMNELDHKEVYLYSNNRLFKSLYYDKNGDLMEYSTYHYETWTQKIYSDSGNFIKEIGMIKPRR